MTDSNIPHTQRGFIQYVVLGVILVLAAGAIAFLQPRKGAPKNDLTASLVGTGGVTITAPNNNATLTSPVQVTAYVASGFTGPVKTMQVFVDNTLVYQGAGTTVDTNVTHVRLRHPYPHRACLKEERCLGRLGDCLRNRSHSDPHPAASAQRF